MFHKSPPMVGSATSRRWLLVILACVLVDMCAGKCKLFPYVHNAVQTDINGRSCRGDVNILSCRGYCLSYELADWQFPYKESHHPVCVHEGRRHGSAILENCDKGVEAGTEVYRYVEAANCKCQTCSSEDTSCEWLPESTGPDGLIPQNVDNEV